MSDLPPNIRRLLAEKYPPGPRAIAALTDAMRQTVPALERAVQQVAESMNLMNHVLRRMNTCRLCRLVRPAEWTVRA